RDALLRKAPNTKVKLGLVALPSPSPACGGGSGRGPRRRGNHKRYAGRDSASPSLPSPASGGGKRVAAIGADFHPQWVGCTGGQLRMRSVNEIRALQALRKPSRVHRSEGISAIASPSLRGSEAP